MPGIFMQVRHDSHGHKRREEATFEGFRVIGNQQGVGVVKQYHCAQEQEANTDCSPSDAVNKQ